MNMKSLFHDKFVLILHRIYQAESRNNCFSFICLLFHLSLITEKLGKGVCAMQSTKTFFAPAGRVAEELLHDQSETLKQADFVATMLDAMPTPAMMLNEHRQIVVVNKRLLQVFGIEDANLLIGRRHGEALGCIHYSHGPDGCGTTPNCSVCGLVGAILNCQTSGGQESGECRIMLSSHGGTALDLEATASPLQVAGRYFTVFALKDISAEKRKQVMERTFFHDIINTAGGIRGLASLLVEGDLSRDTESQYENIMMTLSGNLVEEIQHQRRLIAAERGEYEPEFEEVDLSQMLQEICELYRHHVRVPGRHIKLISDGTCLVSTDPPVLRRIIGNMVLNGMEAIAKGETVMVSSRLSPASLRIEVSNPGEIPPDIQLKMFNRSFSTKATAGRGIGTYSMKLFGERYLGGKVGFNCMDDQTTFYIELPRKSGADHP
jgi:Histidine kinase-, DNA gyrase B-, and HSP90-like ATPase